jgi:ATP-dependent helicase HepA
LFDLPLVPDLLEQRIGRLDRIGQKYDVCIHVPYFDMSAQQVLLDWYHQGLGAFERTCPTGMTVYEETQEMLHACIQEPRDIPKLQQLINQTASLHRELKVKLEQGRDKLLELNSSGQGRIDVFLEQILQAEQSPKLELFMTRLFDAIGFLQEDHDESCYLLRPTETMISPLPGLDEEGMTITYERTTATLLEHVTFLSWDHPMIQHAMDMLTTDVIGKSSIAFCRDKRKPAGAYWLECLFVLSGKAAKGLQLSRFLPPTPLKICIDAQSQPINKPFIQLEPVLPKIGNQLISALKSQIEKCLQNAYQQAEQEAVLVKKKRISQMQELLGSELTRLQSLQKVNPTIRDEEIEHVANQIDSLKSIMGEARLHLEAVRLIVNNPK